MLRLQLRQLSLRRRQRLAAGETVILLTPPTASLFKRLLKGRWVVQQNGSLADGCQRRLSSGSELQLRLELRRRGRQLPRGGLLELPLPAENRSPSSSLMHGDGPLEGGSTMRR